MSQFHNIKQNVFGLIKVFFPVSLKLTLNGQPENGRERRKIKERVVKSKKKKLSQAVRKKARVENVTLKRIPWISQGARIFSIHHVKKSVRRKKAFIAFLPSHKEWFSDVVTISNQKIGEGIFGVVSIDHINDFVGLKKENILYISLPYLKRQCCKVQQVMTISTTFLMYLMESQ